MSLSDKFYEGLSAPIPVVGAQLPADMTMYAGGPLDALKQHERKYKQQAYMDRLSDQASKRLLAQLAEEGDGDMEMDKVSFIGSNPLSRRAYYQKKLSSDTDMQKVADQYDPGINSSPLPRDTSSVSAEPAPSSDTQSFEQKRDGVEARLGEKYEFENDPPAIEVPQNLFRDSPQQPDPLKPRIDADNSYSSRYSREGNKPNIRYVGRGLNRPDLMNSGEFVNRLQEFSSAYQGMNRDPRIVQPEVALPDTRGFFDRLGDNLYHYGTRAARGLSTGAQMGASYLYDRLGDEYLGQGTFLGNRLGLAGRQSLNDEMARINASLAHAYGYNPDSAADSNAQLYAKRLRGIDTKLDRPGLQAREDLLDRTKFIDQLAYDQLGGRQATPELTQAKLQELRDSISDYYGFEGNRAQTPLIGDDLDGTSFRRAMSEVQDGTFINPAKEQARAALLSDMMANNEEVFKVLNERFGEQAARANMPLAQFAASRMARDLSFDKQVLDYGDSKQDFDDRYESDAQRLDRYTKTRDFTDQVLSNMDERDIGNFITQMNPRVLQRAQVISGLMDKDPDEALRMVNEMDPEEARYLLDQISMLSKYVNPDVARRNLDADRFQVREDRDDFIPDLIGGTDLVNPALQQIGAGGELDQMTGDARDRVFFYNSMRDVPASEGQFYLVEDGPGYNVYYNPTTGEVNREVLGDIPNVFTTGMGTRTPLPRQYYEQYQKQFGRTPDYRG